MQGIFFQKKHRIENRKIRKNERFIAGIIQ